MVSVRDNMGSTMSDAHLIWLDEGIGRVCHKTTSLKAEFRTLISCEMLPSMAYRIQKLINIAMSGQLDKLL